MDEYDCCLAEWKAMRVGGQALSFSVLDEESTIHRIKEIEGKLTVDGVTRFEGLLLFHFQTITHNVTTTKQKKFESPTCCADITTRSRWQAQEHAFRGASTISANLDWVMPEESEWRRHNALHSFQRFVVDIGLRCLFV